MGLKATGRNLATRGRTRAAWVLLALLASWAAVEASLWWRAARWNAAIAEVAAAPPGDAASVPLPADGAPELRFAAAWRDAAAADAQASRSAREAALARYRPLQDDSTLGQAARFNGANLLMRQAIEMRAGAQPGQAIALIELAKEGYRELLRHDPGFWPARYNLERAQRLLPEPDGEPEPPPEAPPKAERAATTMRGYSPGLP